MRPNPFVGPRSFRTGERLYGRDRDLRRLLDLLIAERIVLLHAPSGAGKTSLVQAALLPALTEEGFAVLPPIRVNLEPPADDSRLLGALLGIDGRATQGPNRFVLSALLSLEEGQPADQQLPLSQLATLSLNAYLAHREAGMPENDGLVLLFDQFEEILTVEPTDVAAKEAFFAQVGAALYNRRRWALFSMRDDYVGSMEPFLRPIPTQLANTFHLDLLDLKGALEAMQLPVRAVGGVFTPAAARQLADDLRRVTVMRADGSTVEQLGPYLEPVQLQVVCYRLWASMAEDDFSVDPEDVAALGDVDQALTSYYAERAAAIAAASEVSERAIREWCEHDLITEQGIRGQVPAGAARLDQRAIAGLVDAHLVRGEKRRGATWLELAHDRLIAPVKADNAAWREANLSPLQRQAALWERQARPDGLLFRDETLREAEQWAAANPERLTPSEHDFLAASRAARALAERERRNTRRIKLLGVASAVMALLAMIVAVIAGLEWREAETARKIADIRHLSAQAANNSARHPELALLLAIEASSRASSDEQSGASREEEGTLRQIMASTAGRGLDTTSAQIQQLAFSPDGELLAALSNNTVSLWRQSSGDGGLVPTTPITDTSAMAFSPDGRTLATIDTAGQLFLWDSAQLQTRPRPIKFPAIEAISFLTFSPDGKSLVIANYDTVYLWDVIKPGAIPQLLNYPESDSGLTGPLAISPHGRFLAASFDNSIALWDLRNPGTAAYLLADHEETIHSFVFSPDEHYLASASYDDTGRVWDLTSPNASPNTTTRAGILLRNATRRRMPCPSIRCPR